MSHSALADLAHPALRRAGWAARGPVVARERGPEYAANGDADEDRDGALSGAGRLGALLDSLDCEEVGAALAGLSAERLAGVLAAAIGRLGGEAAAATVTVAARPLAEDAALEVCRSLLGDWDSARLLTIAEEAVTALGRRSLSPGAVSDADLHNSWERLHRLERRVVGEKLRRLREIIERASYRTEGARSVIELLTRHGLTYGEAREQAETATALAELPKTDKALADGTIGPGQAAEAGKALNEAKKARADAARRQADARAEGAGDDAASPPAAAEARAADEREAAAHAAERDEIDDAVAGTAPDVNRRELRDRLERQAARRAPGRASDKERRAYRNRYARKFRERDGDTLQVHGPAAAMATIWRMLQALANATSTDDDRTPEQRRFDALRHVADRYLRTGRLPDVAGHPAQVLLIGSHAALHGVEGADPCTLDGYGPVPSETARMICCDAEITVLVMDDDGQPLRLGRTRYAPTRAQRRAVTARDRVCIGCGADTAYCEVHHIRWWRNNGTTDIENLVLCCWNCHTHIHHHGWSIWRDADGRYRTGPQGPPADARPVDGGAPGGGGRDPRPPPARPAAGRPPPGGTSNRRRPRVPPEGCTSDARPCTARRTDAAGAYAESSLWKTDTGCE